MARRFGKVVVKPNKANPKRLEASYRTPETAFDRWPGLKERQTKNFSLDDRGGALAWLDHAKKLIEAGRWEPETLVRHRERTGRLTLGEYYPGWLEHRTFKGRPLKAGTRYRLSKDIENHVLPYFGNTRLVDITQSDIDSWLATMPADQEAMRANALRALKSMLRSASMPGEHGEPPLIPRYPCTRSLPKPRKKSETVPATPQQVKAIYDAMPARYAMSIYLAVFCDGLRIGEVCALQRGDFDLDRRVMRVRRGRVTMDPTKSVDTPKTASSIRNEVIPSQLAPLLDTFFTEYAITEPGAWLFPELKDPSAPVHPNSLRSWFAKARVAADRPDLRFHDLRHTGLTWLAEEGATVRELMDAAGHADMETAMRYQHSVDTRKQRLAEKLGGRLLPEDTPETVLARIRALDEQISGLEAQREQEKQQLQKLLQ